MARTESQKAANAAYMRNYRQKNRDEINRKQREVYAVNPEPAKARGAEWRASNPEKYKEQIERQTERYQNDPEYRDYLSVKGKESRDRCSARIKEYEKMRWERDRERLSEYRRQWRKENAVTLSAKKMEWERQDKLKNPGKYKAKYAAYRAMMLQRTPPWADMKAIAVFYDNCPEGYEVDHIVPLQGKKISGLHVLDNLQYLTPTENKMKSNAWDDDE